MRISSLKLKAFFSLTVDLHPVVVLDHLGVGRQQFVVRAPADEGVVVVSRLRVVLHEADGHIAVVDHRLVQGLQGPEAVGRGGASEPFDSSRWVRTPDLARDVVIEPGREGLQRSLDFRSLRWNCKDKPSNVTLALPF